MIPRWARCGLFVFVLAALACLSARAEAAERRLVLVRPDASLLHAVLVALSSWSIDVVASSDEPPAGDALHAQPAAERLSSALGADAVAWVEATGDGAVLFVYDAASKALASRVLDAPPPFDDARAAAVALSLKTLLRSSPVAPVAERFGASAPPPPPPPPDVLRVELFLAERFLPANVAEPRGAVGVSYWPRFLGGHFGVGLDAETDIGANVHNSVFSGTFEDLSFAGSVRARAFLSPRLVLEPALGFSLHDLEIEGTVLTTGTPVEVDYLDAALGATIAAEYRFGAFGIGLFASGEYLLRYQDYVARGKLVLDGSPWLSELGIRASVGVF